MQITVHSYCVGLDITNDAGASVFCQLSSEYGHRSDAEAALKRLGHREAQLRELEETYDLTDPVQLRAYQHHIERLFTTCGSSTND